MYPYSIYEKGVNDKRFKQGWAQTDMLDIAEKWLNNAIEYDHSKGRRNIRYQIREKGRKIIKEAMS